MDYKKLITSTIAIFIFVYLADMLIHGYFLMGYYEATSHVWRSNMNDFYMWGIISNLGISLVFSMILSEWGSKDTMKLGLLSGLLVGAHQFGSYVYLPITTTIATMWLIACAVKGLGIGFVFSIVDNR